jgi:hypothetical protein
MVPVAMANEQRVRQFVAALEETMRQRRCDWLQLNSVASMQLIPNQLVNRPRTRLLFESEGVRCDWLMQLEF